MNNLGNINKIKQLYSNYGEGNIQGIIDALADDIIWIDAGYPDIPFGSQGRTKKEIPQFFKSLSDNVSYTKFEPKEFFTDKDSVIVKGYHEGFTKSKNFHFGHDWIMVWKFNESGKVNYFQSFIDTAELAKGF